jgi:uncharacterized protein
LDCGRCLEPFSLPWTRAWTCSTFATATDAQEDDEVDLSERDMVVAYYDGVRLDLGEMIREQFFLSVPLKRLCREDCRGLCPACGINRNAASCACVVQGGEPRLAGWRSC